jgi:hypothetical protein
MVTVGHAHVHDWDSDSKRRGSERWQLEEITVFLRAPILVFANPLSCGKKQIGVVLFAGKQTLVER